MSQTLLDERKSQVHRIGEEPFAMACDRPSLAGAVSQRACVFCGSRVVLYPIADALHLVHGPIGCATYTWDIRGAISSGPQLHRLSFSTDLQEMDVIFGGEKKLEASLRELISLHNPKAAFVYSTCIVGLIGDDMEAVCRRVAADTGIPVLPVMSEGFKGNKREGYTAACKAMFRLVGTGDATGISPLSVNILGDFNLAGETWIVREYFRKMGVEVVANITGDGRVDDIRRCHGAALNLVQCSGATMELAKMMEEKYGIPSIRVSYFGIEDMAEAQALKNALINSPSIVPGIGTFLSFWLIGLEDFFLLDQSVTLILALCRLEGVPVEKNNRILEDFVIQILGQIYGITEGAKASDTNSISNDFMTRMLPRKYANVMMNRGLHKIVRRILPFKRRSRLLPVGLGLAMSAYNAYDRIVAVGQLALKNMGKLRQDVSIGGDPERARLP